MGRLAASLCVVAVLAMAAAEAETPTALYLDGKALTLTGGLAETADGKVWITVDDVQGALGVAAKRLIPRPPERRRPRRRDEQRSWVLCGASRCSVYRGALLGTDARPTFELAKVARALGYRMRRRGTTVRLTSPVRLPPSKEPARARVGAQAADLALPDLEGKTHRLGAKRGRRLLLVTWSSWSPSRDLLDEWYAAWQVRERHGLDLWFVAVDIAGNERVKDYVRAASGAPILVDRNADLLRRLPANDVGRWYLFDELGILRAEGQGFGQVELTWIDQHLDEALVTAEGLPPPAARTADIDVLRERSEAEPRSAKARLDYAAALEPTDMAAARKQIQALVKLKPRSVPYAFRLARMTLQAGDHAGALNVLDEARRRMPGAWVIRKQYWALEEPGRFYGSAIDLAWQKQKRKEEKEWADLRKRRR